MRMCRKADRGFTLLELMLSLVIIGIMLGVGMAFYIPTSSAVGQAARSVARQLSSARVDAMLGRRKVCLEFEEGSLFRLDGPGARKLVCKLPAGIGLVIDGKPVMMSSKEQFVFGSLGYTAERLIYLHDGKESHTIYVPSIGAPTVRLGMNGLEELRKAVQ